MNTCISGKQDSIRRDQKGNFSIRGDASTQKSIPYTTNDMERVKPLLLDLFSGAGGAARGYADAGFEVIGVDVAPQKHYPYSFYQANALDVLGALLGNDNLWQGYALDDFAVIHASPPCQEYSCTRFLRDATVATPRIREKLVSSISGLLRETGLPYVVENVPGSPMPDSITLCGSMFGLPLRRHRWFSCSHYLYAPCACRHTETFVNVLGNKVRGYGEHRKKDKFFRDGDRLRAKEGQLRKVVGQTAMDINWMTIAEMSEAIPPAYTKWIGQQLLAIVESERVA